MDTPEKPDKLKLMCAHGNYPGTCPICLEKSIVESLAETKEAAPLEFGVDKVRGQLALLERESGHDITEADLSLEQTIANKEKQRTTFVLKLSEEKAIKYFKHPNIFFHFMNEPYHRPPRYEIDILYCNSKDSNDIISAETIYKYVNGAWEKE